MKIRKVLIIVACAMVSVAWLVEIPAIAQTAGVRPAQSNMPRIDGGKPDLNGLWQVLNTAAWDIQDHIGQLGVPPGQGVVEGNEIPYQPQAEAKRRQNFTNRLKDDPT